MVGKAGTLSALAGTRNPEGEAASGCRLRALKTRCRRQMPRPLKLCHIVYTHTTRGLMSASSQTHTPVSLLHVLHTHTHTPLPFPPPPHRAGPLASLQALGGDACVQINKRLGFNPRVGKIWRRKWQPTPVFMPGKSQGRGAWRAAVHVLGKSNSDSVLGLFDNRT